MADVAQIDIAQPLPPLLSAAGIEHGAPPGLAVEFEEALDRKAGLPEQMVQIELVPVHNFQFRLDLLKIMRARKRRENGKARPVEPVSFYKIPKI